MYVFIYQVYDTIAMSGIRDYHIGKFQDPNSIFDFGRAVEAHCQDSREMVIYKSVQQEHGG